MKSNFLFCLYLFLFICILRIFFKNGRAGQIDLSRPGFYDTCINYVEVNTNIGETGASYYMGHVVTRDIVTK